MDEKINEFLERHLDYLKDLIAQIATICSPTGREKIKAEFVFEKLKELGINNAYIDEVGNVIYEHKVKEKATLYCAHIDTVFNDITEIVPKVIDNKMYAPSIADNSSGIAGLLLMIKMIIEFKFDLPIIFAFDIGEEGLGNLNGMKYIMQKIGDKVSEVVAIDAWDLEKVVNRAVGSKRYRIIVKTEGGHSWEQFGSPNAIAIASNIITKIYKLNVPDKTTYNVGIIHGGSAVNSIAAETEFVLDIRSENQDILDNLEKDITKIIKSETNVEMILLGSRPSGGFEIQTEIEKRILKVRENMGIKTEFSSSSTDINISLSMKIPSINFGIVTGYKAHTINEYIELNSLETGIKQLAYFMIYDYL